MKEFNFEEEIAISNASSTDKKYITIRHAEKDPINLQNYYFIHISEKTYCAHIYKKYVVLYIKTTRIGTFYNFHDLINFIKEN
jgi:hypothetical protein